MMNNMQMLKRSYLLRGRVSAGVDVKAVYKRLMMDRVVFNASRLP